MCINHDALTKENNYATLLEAVAHIMKKHDDEILDIKHELHQMTSKVSQLEKEMRTLKETSSEANLARNIGSTIQQNYKSTTDEEVEITNEVKSGKAEVPKSSNEQTIQNKDTDPKCKWCGNKYETEKMLQKHMNTKHDNK